MALADAHARRRSRGAYARTLRSSYGDVQRGRARIKRPRSARCVPCQQGHGENAAPFLFESLSLGAH